MNASQCWPIRDFARAVGAKVVAVLVAYFDESGISANQEIAVVGGAVARNEDWFYLESRWNKLLASFGLDWYHATDCEAGDRQFRSFTRGVRTSITNGLSIELGKLRTQAFGSAVWRRDFEMAPFEIRERAKGDPFFVCLELSFQQIADWAAQYAPGERVAIVFSRQKQYEGRTQLIYEAYAAASQWRDALGSLTTDAEPRQLVPLQAADLLSYEMYRFAINQRRNPNEPVRKAWDYLAEGDFSLSFMVHDLDSLHKVLEDRNDRKAAALIASEAHS